MGIKKHRYQNGAVQRPSFIFPPFQAWEAPTFLSVPSRLFSPPSACHGFSLGKTARRELINNLSCVFYQEIAKQVQCIDTDIEAVIRGCEKIMSLPSPHLVGPLQKPHLLQPLPLPLLLLQPLLLSFQHVGN